MVGIRDGRPQRGPLAVHCFCVCRRSALLGDLTGVSTTMELDFLCVMSYPNYPRYRLLLEMSYCVILFCVCSLCWFS